MFDDLDDIDIVSLKIIEKNALSKSKRQATERKEELSKVLNRVENIYGEFEKPTIFSREFSSLNSMIFKEKSIINDDSTIVECVKDVPALEQLLVSYQSRQKYLQQVTVFIVGYSKMATDRLRLMQEVNQFFISSEDVFDSFIERENKILSGNEIQQKNENEETNGVNEFGEDEEYTTSELENNVQQAIQSCQELTNRLGELNNEMIDCFVKYTQNKAGNKGKKKMEKALENALNESTKLNEKLSQSMKVLSEKDARIESLIKQCESKSKEVQKFKTAAESIKKTAMEAEKLKEQLKDKEAQILRLQSELIQTQLKIEQTKTLDAAQRANAEETAIEFQEKYKNLEKVMEGQKVEFEEIKRSTPEDSDIKRQQAAELKQVQTENENSLQQIKVGHQQEMQQLKSSEFDENAIALQWSEPEDDDGKAGQNSTSSLSKNDNETSAEKKVSLNNSGSRSIIGSGKNESRQRTISGRSSGKDILTFSDAPDLDNEEFWSTVPRNHLLGRFFQYRQLSMVALSNLLDQNEKLQTKSTRQIYALKSQHQQHQHRWDQEREMLIQAVKNTEDERKDAQKYADLTMKEMEDFMSSLKSEEKDKSNSLEDTSDLGLIETIEKIREYLKNNNMLKDPINKMIEDLLNKCQLFQERSRISVPKYVTMMDLRKTSTLKQNLMASETQTDEDKRFSVLNTESFGITLDENKDIIFPEEIDEDKRTRSVAISASSTLVRIAFYNDGKSNNETPVETVGVTANDLETPKDMVDIQDRTGLNLIQHPVVTDYLHSYDQILTFKEQLISILEELDKIDISEVMSLRQLSPVSIRSQSRIIPQIEDMGKSIEKILQMSLQILEHVLLPKRKFDYKSNKETKSRVLSPTKGKQLITTDKAMTLQIRYLQEDCKEMKSFIKLLQQSYQSKFNIINNSMTKLRHMFSILYKQYLEKIAAHERVHVQNLKINADITQTDPVKIDNSSFQRSLDYDSISMFFTRRDSERNIKRMQQAILDNEFPESLFKEAVEKMSEYIEIPAKQLYILVRKYLHKDAMEKIAHAVKSNQYFTKDTFKILNKMETQIEMKQQRYTEIQEYLRNERLVRANQLTDTLEKIEIQSSILMIKPILSSKTKCNLKRLIENKNLITKTKLFHQNFWEKRQINKKDYPLNEYMPSINKEIEEKPLHFSNYWKPDQSIDITGLSQNLFIESRLLEIDTNRMLLPLNNVSVPYNIEGFHSKESIFPPQIAVRSYVAVAHPTLVDIDSSPPNSKPPSRVATAKEINAKSRMSRDLSKHLPLPPIIPLETNEKDDKINKENQVENFN